MTGDEHSIGREIETTVFFVVSGVFQEDTQGGSEGEFVGGGGRQVGRSNLASHLSGVAAIHGALSRARETPCCSTLIGRQMG